MDSNGEGDMDGVRKQIIANATVLFSRSGAPEYMTAQHEYTVIVTYSQYTPSHPYTARLLRGVEKSYQAHTQVAVGPASNYAAGALLKLLRTSAAALEETKEGWQAGVQKTPSEGFANVLNDSVDASVMPKRNAFGRFVY